MPSRFREVWSGEWEPSDVVSPTATSPLQSPPISPPEHDHRTEWLNQQANLGHEAELKRRPSRLQKKQKVTTSQRLVKRKGPPSRTGTLKERTVERTPTVGSSTVVRSTYSWSRGTPSVTSRTNSTRLHKPATEKPMHSQQDKPAALAEEVRRSDTTQAGQDSPLLHKPDCPTVIPDRHGSKVATRPRPPDEPRPHANTVPETRAVERTPPASVAPPLASSRPYHSNSTEMSAAPSAEDVLTAAQSGGTNTTYHKEMLPAVVHETRRKEMHHIRHDVVTREIHNHDVFHRVLPIIQIDKRATRHFVQAANGTLVEIDPKAIPARSNNWRCSVVGEEPALDSQNPAWLRLDPDEPAAEDRGTHSEPWRKHRTHIHPAQVDTGGLVELPESTDQHAASSDGSTPKANQPRSRPAEAGPAKSSTTKHLPDLPRDERNVGSEGHWPPPRVASEGKAPLRSEAVKVPESEPPTLWPPTRPRSKGNKGRSSTPKRPGDVVWWQVDADA